MTAYLNITFLTLWRRGWQLPVPLGAVKASPPHRWPLTLVVVGCYAAVVWLSWQNTVAAITGWSLTFVSSPPQSLNASAVISSVQTTPNISSHSASQCTRGTACASGVIDNFGTCHIHLHNFLSSLLCVMSLQGSYHRLCAPRRPSQSW